MLEEIGAGETPRLIVLNKVDLLDEEERSELATRHPDAVPISAVDGRGLEELRERIEAAFADTLRRSSCWSPTRRAPAAELHELAGDLERDRPRGRRARHASPGRAAPVRGPARQRPRAWRAAADRRVRQAPYASARWSLP